MQIPERTEDGGNPMMHFHASQRGGSWWIPGSLCGWECWRLRMFESCVFIRLL